MRKIQTLIVALVAMFAFSLIASSAASAATEPALWLVEGGDIPTGGITVMAITEKVKSLLLTDDEAGPLKQETGIECEANEMGVGQLGLLLPNGEDETNSAHGICVRRAGHEGACSANPSSIEGVNLPWLTRLVQITGSSPEEFRDEVYAGTGGNPGWLVECETALGKRDDTCTTVSEEPLVINETDGLINIEFMNEPAENASCTEGKAKSGLVEGLIWLHYLLSSGELMTIAASLP